METNTFYAERKDSQIDILRERSSDPIVTQAAESDHRPYLHPIVAPDGVGELTEYSPGHHPHQTGLYWGFTRVNGTENTDPDLLKEWFYKKDKPTAIQRQTGRDFFHNPGAGFWQRIEAEVMAAAGSKVEWRTTYNMLDDVGNAILIETQTWSLCARAGRLVLDLVWPATAQVDIRIGAFAYGGLFLRMPYRPENGGRILNSEDADQPGAEGQRACWVSVEMPIPGRERMVAPQCWIAIMDHPSNPEHPTPWRADGQLGVGPCRALAGDWEIPVGTSAIFRHRLLVACGALDRESIDREWEVFST